MSTRATFNRAGLVRESWLATNGGHYDPGVKTSPFAQICLVQSRGPAVGLRSGQPGCPGVRRRLPEVGQQLLDQLRPRGHGHGAQDGNLAHHAGLYDVLARLRAQFPDLIIENCAEGGNRLDPGMLQFTDTAWMDDVTSPSSHVRHNLDGLGAIFPPAYLLSFVKDDPSEPIHGAADMPFYFRSRMSGVLGLSLRGEEFGDADRQSMTEEIALYKSLRDRLADGSLLALTPQNGAAGYEGWDVVEVLSASTGDAFVYAFATGAAADWTDHPPPGPRPRGHLPRHRSGRPCARYTDRVDLMLDGIGVGRRAASAASVLRVTKQTVAASSSSSTRDGG